ncbi:hypothetical protein THAOC_21706 [Thalassiosira oceanica]|uniref:BZIP domain-containing protein n=1 Tax=Thalassiosira oceanica TaxID=159749 RepID=K0RYX2_THAOC|nr:hypothetical protein THAOC_21706 [Thalassiosira oceanica]|eukprot:EJK58190.1 hypothetical protein THAOC_21706 [Thalassiosira oceanica]
MATLDALQGLLRFKSQAVARDESLLRHPELPVPNPLQPVNYHVIQSDDNGLTASKSRQVYFQRLAAAATKRCPRGASHVIAAGDTPSATPRTEPVPNPLLKAVTPLMRPLVSAAQHASELELDGSCCSNSRGIDSGKIQVALQSKPQRGKKRKDLTEEERLELTRQRNREHARSTRRHIVEFVENVNVKADQKCRLAVKLIRLVERQLSNPELAVLGEIALSSGDVAMAHVSARGNVANESKTMTGVVSASFRPGATELQDLSICLTDLPISDSSSNAGALFPSVSFGPP